MAVDPESVLPKGEYGRGVVGPIEGERHAFVMSMLASLDPVTGVDENPWLSLSTGAATRTTSAPGPGPGEAVSSPGVTKGRGVIQRSEMFDILWDGHTKLLGMWNDRLLT